MKKELIEKIKERFAERIENIEELTDGKLSITIKKDALLDLSSYLRDDEYLAFDYLECISGVDLSSMPTAPSEDRIEFIQIVYHLFSFKYHHSLVLKVNLNKENPQINSLSAIYKTANWQEREIYDLLGVHFIDHPDLRRILLPEDWVGFPLRKDYTETWNLNIRKGRDTASGSLPKGSQNK